ncbi:MAG TPA: aspartate aminotransferase family protein [Thermomicrobiales bacterium]|nr:aspartate aminotransferase family protein [Thermomicrobiales bacterium]
MATETIARSRQEVEAAVLAEYRARTPRSAELHEAARRVMPGGDTRTIAFHAPYPLAVTHGEGFRYWDADGNEYIDLLNNYTSLIHGHAYPAVTEAVTAQLPRGTAFPAPNPYQTRLAEIITGRVASVDLVRFCNSGSEAVMNAIRAARAFTGRDLLVKMEGGYDGTYDDVEVSVHPDLHSPEAGTADAPLPTLDTPGVPRNTTEAVTVLPFNDVAAAERLFRERGDEIAAVIVEPVMGAGGMIPAESAFLEALRALTIEAGALLIFDEVMSFRLMPGGVQEHYRIRPDLTTFAKIIGGGFPVGGFGGRAAVMEQFDPHRPRALSQSGTFNGNLITMVAGVAAMEAYPAAEVHRINALGDRLRTGLERALAAHGVVAAVIGFGSFVGVHLGVPEVRNYREAAAVDRGLTRLLHLALLLEGVSGAPRMSFNTSTPMSEATIDDILARFDRALTSVRPALVG